MSDPKEQVCTCGEMVEDCTCGLDPIDCDFPVDDGRENALEQGE